MLILYFVSRRTHAFMKARTCKKTRAILDAIAEGNTFEQILGRYPKVGCHDIFRAAAEAPLSDSPEKPSTEIWVVEHARAAAALRPASPVMLRAAD